MKILHFFIVLFFLSHNLNGDRHHHQPPKIVPIINVETPETEAVDTYKPSPNLNDTNSKYSSLMPQEDNIPKINCYDVPCPENRGICNLLNRCICFKEFYSMLDYDTYGRFQCNYERKSQMIAFFLEFIISFGLGHYYLGNILIGMIKTIFCSISVTAFLIMPYLTIKKRHKKLRMFTPYVQLLITLSFCIWQIIDSILFGINFYKDGNGVLPKSW